MSFPYSYSVLGLVPGLILTVVQAAFVLYTSIIVWYVVRFKASSHQKLTHSREFCLRHPETRDVCDIGQMLFWNSKIAWWATAVMFILNNTFIQVCGHAGAHSSRLTLGLGTARLDWRQVPEHDDEP